MAAGAPKPPCRLPLAPAVALVLLAAAAALYAWAPGASLQLPSAGLGLRLKPWAPGPGGGDWPQQRRQQQQQQPAPAPQGSNDSYVALCLSARDEHCDLREWVLHHAALGVGKAYVFDTGSSPPMEAVLADLVASGLVEYRYLTPDAPGLGLERPGAGKAYNWQKAVYRLCLEQYGRRHRWMGEPPGGAAL